MRIINQPMPGVTKAYNQHNKENGIAKTERNNQQDKINISHEAQFFNIAKAALKQLPEVDERKLEELKQSINNGTYEIKNQELIEKILEESFFKHRF
ncbi:MAG: flagellar biosynthesis anti-sigma factor FlgM [Clostridia bacterium]|jgi:negative regulator of flagellin synthesis FlgM|nr:flagellar biosynthesis anti-sigma factor FlgM [Clostridia bacterium]